MAGAFVLDNLTFDLITVLHEKSKALEAYDKYLRDASGDQELSKLLSRIRDEDRNHVQQLQQHLGRVISSSERKAA
jgi:hypothetical protein